MCKERHGRTIVLRHKPCPNAILSTKNPTQSIMQLNPGFAVTELWHSIMCSFRIQSRFSTYLQLYIKKAGKEVLATTSDAYFPLNMSIHATRLRKTIK
jgi:hypothetical protein